MMYHQASFSWIAWILLGAFVVVFFLGISLAPTDLFNWNTHAASADTTRTAAAELSAMNVINRIATTTALAVEYEKQSASIRTVQTKSALEAQNSVIFARATQTAVALNADADQRRAAAPPVTPVPSLPQNESAVGKQQHEADANEAYPVFFALAGIFFTGTIFVGIRSVLVQRARLSEIEIRRIEEQSKLVVAEAQRYEKQAQVLQEQRRKLQVAAVISVSEKGRGQPSTRTVAGNGHDHEEPIEEAG